MPDMRARAYKLVAELPAKMDSEEREDWLDSAIWDLAGDLARDDPLGTIAACEADGHGPSEEQMDEEMKDHPYKPSEVRSLLFDVALMYAKETLYYYAQEQLARIARLEKTMEE